MDTYSAGMNMVLKGILKPERSSLAVAELSYKNSFLSAA